MEWILYPSVTINKKENENELYRGTNRKGAWCCGQLSTSVARSRGQT
jgi:hypothetical protein